MGCLNNHLKNFISYFSMAAQSLGNLWRNGLALDSLCVLLIDKVCESEDSVVFFGELDAFSSGQYPGWHAGFEPGARIIMAPFLGNGV